MQFNRHPYANLRDVELNLTSMIDVIFLLLVFFVATASIALPESRLSPALQTSKKESGDQGADFVPQVVEVSDVNGTPVYRIGGRVLRDRRELTSILRELPKELGVFVKVSDSVPVGFTTSAIQCCHDAGFEKVTYVPEPKP